MAASSTQTSDIKGTGVPLGARVEIMPGLPLPEFNSIGGQAFVARIKNETTTDLMAIVCNTGLFPRVDAVTSMRNVDHPSILRLIDSGVVHWPQNGTNYYALAFQRPLAPRMMMSLDEQHPTMSEDAINHYFVTPMAGALNELMRTGVSHNAIRPTNIFWRIGSATMPQLGEFLSAPPGNGQPVLFETLERAMSMPLGRGTGSHVDDCYAFGITLAFIIFGLNPMQGMDDNAIIQAKIERGSFGAIVGSRRLAATHIELLRGLLTDDARQRWTAADLEQWLSGRRLTPKNTDAGRRASRHIDFAGKSYWQLRPLAVALAANVSEAVKLIENGTLNKWLRRAMGDEDRAINLEDAQKSLKESGKTANYEDQLVARACIALDPPGPIRYRGLAVMPAGVANMMVDAVLNGTHVQALSEIIVSQLITLWVEMQKEAKIDLVPLAQQYERLRGVMEKTSFGNGLEHVIYDLNQGLPCLSPMLRPQYVMTPKALLAALERVATAPGHPSEPMDRHIAAFLVVRDRRSGFAFEAMGAADNTMRRGLAMLSLYSEMQQRYGPDAVPHLAQWLLPLLESSVQRYLSKTLREKVQKEFRDVAGSGNLAALARLLDDPRRIESDRQEFMAARMLYLNILKEIASTEGRLANREAIIRTTGKPTAAALSSLLAIILVLATIARAVWQGLGF